MTTFVEQPSQNQGNRPNSAPGKKPAAVMQGTTVRQKIYMGFGGLMLLTALNVGYSMLKLNDVGKIGVSAFQHRQPAANLFQRLVQDLNGATALLNNYLLTGQKNQREDFNIVAQSIKERLAVAH